MSNAFTAYLVASNLVIAVGTWYATHKSQIAAFVQAAQQLGPAAAELFQQIQAQTKAPK